MLPGGGGEGKEGEALPCPAAEEGALGKHGEGDSGPPARSWRHIPDPPPWELF